MHAQEKGGKPKRRKNRMISRYMLYRKLKNKTKQKKTEGKIPARPNQTNWIQ